MELKKQFSEVSHLIADTKLSALPRVFPQESFGNCSKSFRIMPSENSIFTLYLRKQFEILFLNNYKLDNFILNITYPPCLHLCSTLGGFSRFNRIVLASMRTIEVKKLWK